MAGDSSDSDPRGELEENHKDAYGWALNCCDRRREDAEDVLQTVYLKVLGGKARFNGNSSFRTWLFALIRNTAADRRRSWFRRLLGEQKMAPSPITPSPDRSKDCVHNWKPSDSRRKRCGGKRGKCRARLKRCGAKGRNYAARARSYLA